MNTRLTGSALSRPRVLGKYLYLGNDPLLVRGVTYGTFAEHPDGHRFPDPDTVRSDFRQMAATGVNTVRTYTLPPRYLLDAARDAGLMVIVGLFWEGRRLMYDSATERAAVKREIARGVADCRDHPAVLMYCIGNEIPSDIIRWYGEWVIEGFLREITEMVHRLAPGSLVTYAVYPPTEYLDLSFLDVITFNVYLEREEDFRRYLARLQSLAGNKPLLLGETGLDSLRNGEDRQAEALEWIVCAVFQKGLAGVTLFGWTDDWVVGRNRIEDWGFGLVDRDRRPKAALETVRRLYIRPLYEMLPRCPRISVIVAAYNAQDTLAECLDSFASVEYPDFEVLVVDDGSKDATARIAARYDAPIRLLEPGHGGLSAARNAGLAAATGEIVAYTDADCVVPPHWLFYLAASFLESDWAAVGGPNLLPENDGRVARAVDRSPGIATHVLVTDQDAEHIPGCNMAYRRDILRSLGGFNPVYTAAGDDVDMCWRVLGAGYRIGFNAGAVVYHHRRPSVRRYLRQQRGYGRAEVILQEHHPERFNALGGIRWAGSLYDGPLHRLDAGRRVQYGEYGAGLFQSVYYPYWTGWVGLALTPEWYAVTLAAAAVAMALAWAAPMVAFLLGLAAFGGVSCTLAVSGQAALRAARREPGEFATRLAHGALVFLLHLLQPISRATGRISGTGFRAGPAYDEFGSVAAPGYWGDWVDRPGFLNSVSGRLRRVCLGVSSGDGFQRWDLEVTGLPFMTVRLFTAVHDQTVLRHRLSYGITPWFWLVLAPVLLAFTADIADPASAFTVNLAISVLSGLFLLRQRLRYRRLIGGVIDDAAREMGLIPLWPEGARERRPATTTT